MEQQTFSFADSLDGLIVVPIQQNLIDVTCEQVLERNTPQLPDLSNVTILLNDSNAVNYAKTSLLTKAAIRGHSALLGPQLMSLKDWLNEHVDIELGVVNNHARELLLVEALQKHTHIYGQGNPWVLAESLMELFDELTQWHVELPNSAQDFIKKVEDAYGSTSEVNKALSREALLVHTLWYALHQQLAELKLIDQHGGRLLKLGQSVNTLAPEQLLIYCGVNPPTPAEDYWRQQLSQRSQLLVVTHDISTFNTADDSSEYVQSLKLIFQHDKGHLKSRAEECRQLFPSSPLTPVLQVYAASNAEDEALAVDIQVRRWLLKGKKQIGIVTENRKLARRIRALLERANIPVEDNTGWPLSTTSAATVLERWLEAIEDDFHYIPFLDCLKSPFFMEPTEDYLKLVYFLEQHIIIDENVASGIERYLKHIEFRKHKLRNEVDTKTYDALKVLLHQIAHAAEPLQPLLDGNLYDAPHWLDALLDSFSRLHILKAYEKDAAGLQLLNEIEQLKLAAQLAPTQLDWPTFRNWLGLTLERFNFKIPGRQSPVKLLTLNMTEYYSFDAVVIAGAEQGVLPHGAKLSPFFNDAVRSSLGIPTQEDKNCLSRYLFQRLMVSIPTQELTNSILITRRARENDEEIIPSPWLAELQAFHQLAYGSDLSAEELPAIMNHPDAHIKLDKAPPPAPNPVMPKVKPPATLIPTTLSASAYQQLVDCPYRFYAAYCLKLAPPESVREALEKSDYGQRIHKCLEAFHGNVPELPGPFQGKIDPQNRQQAIALLTQISETVFAQDIEDNFMHRGWIKRWLSQIPAYIDWQMDQQTRGYPIATEISIKDTQIDKHVAIRGVIDRLDKNQNQFSIVDYKTGRTPSVDEVMTGETVQLPFYLMLLLQQPEQILYGKVDSQSAEISAQYVELGAAPKVTSRLVVNNENLRTLADKNQLRLVEVIDQIRQGKALPAWGDNQTCEYCPMDGLCRKQSWGDEK